MTHFTAHPRWLAITALLAPAVSLAGATVVAWVVGAAGLSGVLPVGVHTYLPAATMLPIGSLGLVAAAGVLGALACAIARGRASRRRQPVARRRWQLLQLALLGAIAQVALFAAQLIVVEEVQGVADGASAVLLAVAVQAILSALLTVGGWLLARPPQTRLAAVSLEFSPGAVPVAPPALRPASARFLLRHPRRGPPLLPVQRAI